MSDNPQLKILTLNKASQLSQKLRKQGKNIVLCHGVFDLLHPGHIKHFQSAKSFGDILIVTITADKYVNKGPGRPVFNEKLRSEVLSAISAIDYVAIVESSNAIYAISKIKPHVYVKGPDYKNRKPNPNIPRKLGEEEAAVKALGGILKFTDDIIFSSSHLINEHLDVYSPITKKYLNEFKQNHEADAVIETLTTLRSKKILVIGDSIIDEYDYCETMGKSSKEPIVVHRYISKEQFAGGTLATANHLASLSSQVTLISLLGKKRSFRGFIDRRLKPEISAKFFLQPGESTIVKRRFVDMATRQKLFQISFIKDKTLDQKIETQVVKFLKKELGNFDIVIVNDFGHGFLTEKIVRLLSHRAKFLALNVQANSANYGFNVITKYPRADYICIDEHELRLATHDKYGNLDSLIKKIARKMKCRLLLVTRGSNGSISYSSNNSFISTPTFTDHVVDRVGAGDAFFAITAPCVYAGMDEHEVGFVGNVAGALKVQTVGNKFPLEFKDMTKFITRLLK